MIRKTFFTQNFFIGIIILMAVLADKPLSAQTDCARTYKAAPANDCAPCTTSGQNFEVAKTLTQLEEVNDMIARLEEIITKVQQNYEYTGDLTWGRDKLDLDIAKAYEDAIKDLRDLDIMASGNRDYYNSGAGGTNGDRRLDKARNKADDAARNLRVEWDMLKCPGATWNSFTDGVYEREVESVYESSHEIMSLLVAIKQSGQHYNLDCCDPYHNPHNYAYDASESLNREFEKMREYFENLEKVHEVNMESLNWFAMGYRKYDGEVNEAIAKLKGLSFGGVVSNALVDAGIISQDQLDAFNNIVDTYDDLTSMQNAIRNTMGDDAAEMFGATFGDFTVDDLRENFSELVKNHPEKFRNLQKMNPGSGKIPGMDKFLGAISIAENAVQVALDFMLTMNSGMITHAKDLWWCSTQKQYLAFTSSLIQNATALYTLKHMLTLNASFYGNQSISLAGPAPATTAEAEEQIRQALGYAPQGTYSGNRYSFETADGDTINIVFGILFCGKTTQPQRPAEITPEPTKKVTQLDGANNKYDPENEKEHTHEIELGGICGMGYLTGEGAVPFHFDGFTNPAEALPALDIPLSGNINFGKVENDAHIAAWNAGIIINYSPKKPIVVHSGISIGGYETFGDIEVFWPDFRQPTSPTVPPETFIDTGLIKFSAPVRYFRENIGIRYQNGDKIKLFAGCGFSAVQLKTSKVTYTMGNHEYTSEETHRSFGAGGYLELGVTVSLGSRVGWTTSAGMDILAMDGNVVNRPNINTGLLVRIR